MKGYRKYFYRFLPYLNLLIGLSIFFLIFYSAKLWYDFAKNAQIEFSAFSFYFIFKNFVIRLILAILFLISSYKIIRKSNLGIFLSKISWILLLFGFLWLTISFLTTNSLETMELILTISIIIIIILLTASHFIGKSKVEKLID